MRGMMQQISNTLERFGGVNLLPLLLAVLAFLLIGAPSS